MKDLSLHRQVSTGYLTVIAAAALLLVSCDNAASSPSERIGTTKISSGHVKALLPGFPNFTDQVRIGRFAAEFKREAVSRKVPSALINRVLWQLHYFAPIALLEQPCDRNDLSKMMPRGASAERGEMALAEIVSAMMARYGRLPSPPKADYSNYKASPTADFFMASTPAASLARSPDRPFSYDPNGLMDNVVRAGEVAAMYLSRLYGVDAESTPIGSSETAPIMVPAPASVSSSASVPIALQSSTITFLSAPTELGLDLKRAAQQLGNHYSKNTQTGPAPKVFATAGYVDNEFAPAGLFTPARTRAILNVNSLSAARVLHSSVVGTDAYADIWLTTDDRGHYETGFCQVSVYRSVRTGRPGLPISTSDLQFVERECLRQASGSPDLSETVRSRVYVNLYSPQTIFCPVLAEERSKTAGRDSSAVYLSRSINNNVLFSQPKAE